MFCIQSPAFISLSQIIAFQKQIVNINIINFYLPYYYLFHVFRIALV